MARRRLIQTSGTTSALLYKPAGDRTINTANINVRGLPLDKPGFSVAEGETALSAFLTLNGAGADRNIAGNGSVESPVVYSLVPPANQVYVITAINISMRGTNMTYTGFGVLAGLSNGCQLVIRSGTSTIVNLTGAFALQNNGDFLDYASSDVDTRASGTFDAFGVHISPRVTSGATIDLDGASGLNLAVLVRDNLTGVGTFRVHVSGWIEPSVSE